MIDRLLLSRREICFQSVTACNIITHCTRNTTGLSQGHKPSAAMAEADKALAKMSQFPPQSCVPATCWQTLGDLGRW